MSTPPLAPDRPASTHVTPAGPRSDVPAPAPRGEREESWLSMLDELLALAGGVGFVFIAFLAAIPGLLAAVILVAGPLLLIAVPLLVLGALTGVVVGAGWIVLRTIRMLRG